MTVMQTQDQSVLPTKTVVIPDVSRADRTASFAVHDFPVPHGREEEWRFTPLARTGTLLHDGVQLTPLTAVVDQADGVRVEHLDADRVAALNVPAPQDRAAVVAAAASGGAVVVTIGSESAPTSAVRLVVTGEAGAQSANHIVVVAEPHSTATVVVEHRGSGALAQMISVLAGDGSAITLVSVQDGARDAIHLAQHDVRLGRDSSCTYVTLTLGGDLVRMNTNIQFAGPGASIDLQGLYFAGPGQHLEHRSFVDHSTPHCTSNVLYKGALSGDDARTVWVGDVLIRASAEATETYELNRNLVLSPGAQADSVPNLEIETGNIVGAGHASATGRFDDEHVFYLQSRGISEDEAKRLVVRGFFADVVNRVPVEDVRERLTSQFEAKLDQTAAVK